ncbi:MAG: hypothetical protein ABJB16_06890 [Saprospiraceae bacterium]
MKTLTIADLQESGEDYKRHYHDRKIKYMAETEANEEEFLTREYEVWDNCLSDLNLYASEQNDPSFHLNNENLEVLSKAINTIGMDKVFYSVKRKWEFLKNQMHIIIYSNLFPGEEGPEIKQPDLRKVIDHEITQVSTSQLELPSLQVYDIIHVAIACYCLEIDLTSAGGKKLVLKYTKSNAGDSLYKDKYQIFEDYFNIVKNKKIDRAKGRAIVAAKGLIKKLRNKTAFLTITDLHKRFEKEFISHYK